MSLNEALGVIISQLIEAKGYSKLRFSEKTKISRKNLYRILGGEVSPTLDTIEIIAKEFNMSPGRLVSMANNYKNG